jgi:hypothetical protein
VVRFSAHEHSRDGLPPGADAAQPASPSPAGILALQRSAGNAAVSRMVARQIVFGGTVQKQAPPELLQAAQLRGVRAVNTLQTWLTDATPRPFVDWEDVQAELERVVPELPRHYGHPGDWDADASDSDTEFEAEELAQAQGDVQVKLPGVRNVTKATARRTRARA